MNNEEKINYIIEDIDFIDNLDIPFKKDFLECCKENPNGIEANNLISWYENENSNKYE